MIDSNKKTIDLGEAKALSINREAPMPMSLQEYDAGALETIRNTVAKGLNNSELVFFLTYCKNAGWDPFTKEIYAIPRNDGAGGRQVTFQTGIDALRRRAHETQAYAGMEEPEFGPPIQRRAGNQTLTVPQWCRFVVYKVVAGARVRFSFLARWSEYAPPLADKKAFMWRKRPFGQLEKCAEAGVLRRAFSEQLKGLYIHEELEGGIRPQAELDLPDEQLAPSEVSTGQDSRQQPREGPSGPPGDAIPVEARVVDEETPAQQPPSQPCEEPQSGDDRPIDESEGCYLTWREAIEQADSQAMLKSYYTPIEADPRLDADQRRKLGDLIRKVGPTKPKE